MTGSGLSGERVVIAVLVPGRKVRTFQIVEELIGGWTENWNAHGILLGTDLLSCLSLLLVLSRLVPGLLAKTCIISCCRELARLTVLLLAALLLLSSVSRTWILLRASWSVRLS